MKREVTEVSAFRLRHAPFAAWLLALGMSFCLTNAAEADYFETHVRPLFAEHCYSCHSSRAEKPKGGLLMDQIANLRRGGQSGPMVEAGHPEKSLLIAAVQGKAKDLDVMPPKGAQLTPEQIGVLEEWIRRGAALPPEEPSRAGAAGAKKHWAFEKPVAVELPQPRNGARMPRNPIDAFVEKSLGDHQLVAVGRADRRTLLRRVHFDLTGLPPSPEEMASFLGDTTPEAFERAVDRVLASPRYGERWARHWLDIARYADTKGYVFEEERRYSASYTYRDWVVDALNRDLPYDQFLVAQMAGDSLVTETDKTPLAALGFLTLGRRFLNNEADIIDDRLDVVFRGLQGLTIQCSRCHDHKFDPIPMADYYSLYGVFASSREPDPKPLIGANPNPIRAAEYEAERAKRTQERTDFQSDKVRQARKELRDRVGDYLLTTQEARSVGDKREEFIRARKLSPGVVSRWQEWLDKRAGEKNAILIPYFEFAKLSTNEFAQRAGELSQKFSENSFGGARLHPMVTRAFATNPPVAFKEVADRYAELFKSVDAEWSALQSTTNAAAIQSLPDPEREAIRQVLYAADSPVMVDWDTAYRLVPTPDQQRFRALQRRLDELDATHPGAPLRAMAMVDKDTAVEPVIFKRGNPGNPGPKVPRQFLGALVVDRKPFEKGSGRLEMAQSIANRNNPLTARVFVNRVWQYHFGAPLVRTPSDFGVRTDPPTHPEMLDFLSVWFMDHDWSIKQLHRLILTSEAYQRTSDPAASESVTRNEKSDISNTYLWRMNRKRADFESLRDSLLHVSGNLDLMVGGQAAEIFNDNPANRRTVYGFIDRQNLPGVLRAFDFASPDTSASMRFQTTVPQQALFLLNSAFASDLARRFVARPDVAGISDPTLRIRRLFALAFQRDPEPMELAESLKFVTHPAAGSESIDALPAWQYGIGSFDAKQGKIMDFKRMSVFKEGRWQPGDAFPLGDTRGYASITSTGGHPGRDALSGVIRRWIAPVAGTYSIKGKLKHPAEAGDGVVGRVVSSRVGSLKEWTAKHGEVSARLEEVNLQAGEILDFLVDCGGGDNSDSFEWAPVVALVKGPEGAVFARSTWNSKSDFGGPVAPKRPLNSWERLAQALLASNEFVFVD